MSIRTPFAALCLTLAFAGTLSAQKVSTDWDHSANWSKYNSYYIQIQKAFGDQLSQERAIAGGRLGTQVQGLEEGALPRCRERGGAHQRCRPEGRDQHHDVHRRRICRLGLGRRRHGHGHHVQLARTSVGTLVVDIFDVMTKQLLFRGQAQETVSNNAEKNTKALYKATEKMFKDFPPMAAAK